MLLSQFNQIHSPNLPRSTQPDSSPSSLSIRSHLHSISSSVLTRSCLGSTPISLNTLLQLGSNFATLRTSSHSSSGDFSLYRAKPSMPTAQLVRHTRQNQMEEARSSDLHTTS